MAVFGSVYSDVVSLTDVDGPFGVGTRSVGCDVVGCACSSCGVSLGSCLFGGRRVVDDLVVGGARTVYGNGELDSYWSDCGCEGCVCRCAVCVCCEGAVSAVEGFRLDFPEIGSAWLFGGTWDVVLTVLCPDSDFVCAVVCRGLVWKGTVVVASADGEYIGRACIGCSFVILGGVCVCGSR